MIPNGYHQFGILHGVANVDGDNNSRDNALYMYGTRTRRRLTLNHSNDALVEIFAMQDKDGDVLRLMSRNGETVNPLNFNEFYIYPLLSSKESGLTEKSRTVQRS